MRATTPGRTRTTGYSRRPDEQRPGPADIRADRYQRAGRGLGGCHRLRWCGAHPSSASAVPTSHRGDDHVLDVIAQYVPIGQDQSACVDGLQQLDRHNPGPDGEAPPRWKDPCGPPSPRRAARGHALDRVGRSESGRAHAWPAPEAESRTGPRRRGTGSPALPSTWRGCPSGSRAWGRTPPAPSGCCSGAETPRSGYRTIGRKRPPPDRRCLGPSPAGCARTRRWTAEGRGARPRPGPG